MSYITVISNLFAVCAFFVLADSIKEAEFLDTFASPNKRWFDWSHISVSHQFSIVTVCEAGPFIGVTKDTMAASQVSNLPVQQQSL